VEVARVARDATRGKRGGWYHDSNWLTLRGSTSTNCPDLNTQLSISS
jgi:hypothetical protein